MKACYTFSIETGPADGYRRGQKEEKVKKVFLVVILAMALTGLLGDYALADAPVKVFSHYFTITVEPKPEVKVMRISSLAVGPGQPVTVVYGITNHSRQVHWNLTAGVLLRMDSPVSTWTLQGEQYVPGTVFQVPSGATVEMVVTFYVPEEVPFNGKIPINIEIYGISSEEGKG